MNDALLMRVLHRPANLLEQQQPLAASQLVGVAVVGDRQAWNIFHGEPGPSAGRLARVVELGDIGMVQQRQRLTLRLEACDQRVCRGMLDDFERHAAADRLGLLGEINNPHAALTQHSYRPVWPKDARGGRRVRLQQVIGFAHDGTGQRPARRIECEQRLDLGAHFRIHLVLFEVAGTSLGRQVSQFAEQRQHLVAHCLSCLAANSEGIGGYVGIY